MNKRGNFGGDCLPNFFKVYLPDESGDDLELPISFNSFLPKSLPKNVNVRSIYGNVWKMAYRKCCGDIEKFAMVNGWKRVVKDEDLKGGESLEFEFDGSWLFNFCIYGHATCKKLRSSVQTREVKDESRGEYNISSDDDDDGDIGDVYDDQDYGDEDISSENIIIIDDDDQDYNEEGKSSKDIIVIDDDDDDDDADNDDVKIYRRRGVETERKVKGYFGVSKKSNNKDDRQYLDNDMNPYFKVNQNLQRKTDLRVPAKIIKNYALQFPEFINLIDPLKKKSGKLKRKVEGHTIKGFESIIRRNNVKWTDKMICELKMEMNGLVREIKISQHITNKRQHKTLLKRYHRDYTDNVDDSDETDDVEVLEDNDYYTDDDEKKYLDDPENPYFTMTLNPDGKSQLHIPVQVIKDYGLNFPDRITVIDPLVNKFGTMEKNIKIQMNGSIFVKGFGCVIRKNEMKTTDK